MMQLTARMIRAYKGAAASILLLYIANGGQPMTQMEMARGSGYRDEAINEAVWMLREDGLITESGRYTWALLGRAQQLPLGAEPNPLPLPEAGRGAEQTGRGGEDEESGEGSEVVAPDDRELALNESMNESDSIDIEDSLIDSSVSSGKTGAGADVTADILRGFGFYGRGIGEILAIQGMTLREVRYHVENAPSLGAALARIKKRQAVPAGWEAGVAAGQDGRRYIEGRFSEFINY